MGPEITGLCHDHSFEPAAELCSKCGGEFCEDCVVRPFKKPMCKACAIAAAGVRSGAGRPPISKRELKLRKKSFSSKVATRKAPEPTAPVITDPMINDHDPIGPPSGEDLDRIGIVASTVIDQAEDTTADPADGHSSGAEAALADPQLGAAGDGQAPANVDWSRPFD